MTKFIVLVFILLLLGFVQASLIHLPFLLLFVLTWAIQARGESNFWIAFVAGIVEDALSARSFGTTSLFLLLIAFLIGRYQKKVQTQHVVYLILFALSAIVVYQLMFIHTLAPMQLFISLILILPLNAIISILSRWFSKEEQSKLSLG